MSPEPSSSSSPSPTGSPNLNEVVPAPARPEGIARLVLHPHWRCRVAWDGVSTIFLLYNIVIVPFRLCFDSSARCPNPVWVFEAVIDWFFVLDIFVSFMTGVFVSGDSGATIVYLLHTTPLPLMMSSCLALTSHTGLGVISRDLGVIARRYAGSWLLVDLASTAPGPVDFFLSLQLDGCSDSGVAFSAATDEDSGSASVLKLTRALKVAKLIKLMRLLKMSQLLDNLQDHFPVHTFISKALTLVVLVLYIGHVTACLWYWIGTQSLARDTEPFTGERASWLISAGFIVDPRPWEGDNATVIHAALSEKYVGAFYWAFTTMTTVGYGDITPTTARERLFTVAAMMVGASLFGYIIGNVTTLVGNSHASKKQLNAPLETLTPTLSADPNPTVNSHSNPVTLPLTMTMTRHAWRSSTST